MRNEDNTILREDHTIENDKEADSDEMIRLDHARPVCHRELPPPPTTPSGEGVSILLFYQYVEPSWSPGKHREALRETIAIGKKHGITGRGRVAPEGLNCTLTGSAEGIRSFCLDLRRYDPIFQETDFKITDNVDISKRFKSLSLRKAKELVAYGLAGDDVAPSLKKFSGQHLEADQYHEALKDPEAVVIDVRNAYESAIGGIRPPTGGATLIDPRMRNSIEFPRWLHNQVESGSFQNKKVLMYCTGGIRCERATALLNQMAAAAEKTNRDNDGLKLKGVYHCRGGIERYVKTFPKGGFWKGKNYLFDKRQEQTPSGVSTEEAEQDINSKCCICHTRRCSVYRGRFKCNRSLCRVPVLVCNSCTTEATERPESLVCDLCHENHRNPSDAPDLISMKRLAEGHVKGQVSESEHSLSSGTTPTTTKGMEVRTWKKRRRADNATTTLYDDGRLFLRRLPLTVSITQLRNGLGDDNARVHWVVDAVHGHFYGSCIVQCGTAQTVEMAQSAVRVALGCKRVRVAKVVRYMDDDESNGARDHIFDDGTYVHKEYPPVGYHNGKAI